MYVSTEIYFLSSYPQMFPLNRNIENNRNKPETFE